MKSVISGSVEEAVGRFRCFFCFYMVELLEKDSVVKSDESLYKEIQTILEGKSLAKFQAMENN